MGAVTFSIDPNFIRMIKDQLPIDIFVETGTMNGDSVEVVKNHFSTIISIELSEDYFLKAKKRFEASDHVHLIHGDSSHALPTLQSYLSQHPVLFWLDAHWCVSEHSVGMNSQCPLLTELAAIHHLHSNSMIIIDDARLFLAPPLPPHEISHWPTFNDILSKLRSLSQTHYLMILNDFILFYPESIHTAINQYAYHNGVDWLGAMDRSREYEFILNELKLKEEKIQEQALLLKNLQKICDEQSKTLNTNLTYKLREYKKKIASLFEN